MNYFEEVKQNVTTRQAAEFYGLTVSRNGMALCPFHEDRHPSMKVDRRFHCFGCHADGDVIDFTARLFNLKPMEAAQKLTSGISHRSWIQMEILQSMLNCRTASIFLPL